MQRRRGITTIAATLALLTVCGFIAPTVAATTADTDEGPATDAASVSSQGAGGHCDYTALYEKTIDSVVSIQRGGGQGTGFVYDVAENGSTSYVVTNAHVVGEESRVTVRFRHDESRRGIVIGTDVSSDLAVVQVLETPDYANALPVAEESPVEGQRVAALGSPFGLERTITHGIISGLDRSMPTRHGYAIPNVVQTDAPISSGSSGGPLVTCRGKVVGVNVAGIAAPTAENIGFAISSSMVRQVVPSLIRTGEFEHPALGVRATSVTPDVADANNLPVTSGVIVVSVVPGTPASEVLRGSDRIARVNGRPVPVGGDVIVAVEGHSIASTEDLASVLLAETRPGDQVTLTIVRDGQRTNVTTTVIERPEPDTVAPPDGR